MLSLRATATVSSPLASSTRISSSAMPTGMSATVRSSVSAAWYAGMVITTLVIGGRGAGRRDHTGDERSAIPSDDHAVMPLCMSRTTPAAVVGMRSEEHTSELQSHLNLVCRLLLEKKKT